VAKHLAKCPKCDKQLTYESAVGDQFRCPTCGSILKAPGKADLADSLVGQTLGEFELTGILGRGGMGVVYRARQKSLGRDVAVKVLPPYLAADADFLERFHREGRAAAAINHPNIIEIHAIGDAEGRHYIAMELVDGESLADRLKRDGRLAPADAVELLRQVAEALARAHEHNILHRDIKPGNILITKYGRAKVVDFGLAKHQGVDVSVTATGASLGTPLYMPPEFGRGEPADARSDLYSLGATFYQAVAGKTPFDGTTPTELIIKHLEKQVTPLQSLAPDAPQALCRIIHKLLRKSPAERYQSAGELVEALKRVKTESVGRTSPSREASARSVAGHKHAAHSRRHAEGSTGKKSRLPLLLGGLAVAVLVVVLVLVLGSGTDAQPQAKASPEKAPPKAVEEKSVPLPENKAPAPKAPLDPKEKEAADYFARAERMAKPDLWLSAEGYLAKLDKDYTDTEYYADHRADIDALKTKVQAALKESEPAEPRSAPAIAGLPAPDAEGWIDLFDGKTLRGWNLLTEGHFVNCGVVGVSDGAIKLGKGRECTGIHWSQGVPEDDYEVEIVAVRCDGSRDFASIVFPIGDEQAALIVGGFKAGTAVRFADVNGTDHYQPAMADVDFKPGRWGRVRLRVTRSKLTAWIDGLQTIDLPRAGHTFSLHEQLQGCQGLCVFSYATSALIRSIRLRRLNPDGTPVVPEAPKAPRTAPDAEGWIDLFGGKTLEGWVATAGEDGVRIDSGALVIENRRHPPGNSVRMYFDQDVPSENYEIEMKARRLQGSQDVHFIGLRVPVGGQRVQLNIRGYHGSGIGNIDGKAYGSNSTTRKDVTIEDGRLYHVKARISPERIRLWLDRDCLFDVSTEGRTLTDPEDDCVRRGRALGIFVAGKVAMAVESLRVRGLNPDGTPIVPEKPEPEPVKPQVDPKVAAALQALAAKTAAWDFAGAKVLLAEAELPAETLAQKKDEVARLAKLKAKIIKTVNAAKPSWKTSHLLLTGAAGDIVKADGKGLTVKLPGNKTATHAWRELKSRSVGMLLNRVLGRKAPDDWLAAGLLAIALGEPGRAEGYFRQATSLGADAAPYLGPLADAALGQVQTLLDEADFPRAKEAIAALGAKYGETPWAATNQGLLASLRARAERGMADVAAEKLYAQAAKVYASKDLWALKPLVEKLEADFPKAALIADKQRTPTFIEMAEAVSKLGRFIVVRKNGERDFSSIQAAVDAAPPNSIIEIQDGGRYTEKVVIPKEKPGLTLRGIEGRWPMLTNMGSEKQYGTLLHNAGKGTTIARLIIANHSDVPGAAAVGFSSSMTLDSVFLYGRGWSMMGGARGGGKLVIRECALVKTAQIHCPTEVVVEDSIQFDGGIQGWADSANPRPQKVPCSMTNVVTTGVYGAQTGEFTHCTFYSGTGFQRNAGTLRDCIVQRVEAKVEGVAIENCNVYGKGPYVELAKPGKRCFSLDPQFVDPERHDYRLKPTSPCRGRASDRGDIGATYTPKMLELLHTARELRKRGIIKF